MCLFFSDMRAPDLLLVYNLIVCKLLLPGTGPTTTVWQKKIYNCCLCGTWKETFGEISLRIILFLLAYTDEKHVSQDHVPVFLASEMKVHEK